MYIFTVLSLHTQIHVYTHKCMYVYIHTGTYIFGCIYVCLYIQIYIYIHVNRFIHVCTYTWVYIYVNIYVYVTIGTVYMYVYIFVYTSSLMRLHSVSWLISLNDRTRCLWHWTMGIIFHYIYIWVNGSVFPDRLHGQQSAWRLKSTSAEKALQYRAGQKIHGFTVREVSERPQTEEHTGNWFGLFRLDLLSGSGTWILNSLSPDMFLNMWSRWILFSSRWPRSPTCSSRQWSWLMTKPELSTSMQPETTPTTSSASSSGRRPWTARASPTSWSTRCCVGLRSIPAETLSSRCSTGLCPPSWTPSQVQTT